MSGTAQGRDALGAADRSSVLVAAVLGAAAGALGLPLTAAQQFDRLPALFLVGVVVGIGLGVAARVTGGRSGVVLLAALIWVVACSALILAFVKPNGDLFDILAVTSNVAPAEARLTSAVSLGLLSGVVAACSLLVARLVAPPARHGGTQRIARW